MIASPRIVALVFSQNSELPFPFRRRHDFRRSRRGRSGVDKYATNKRSMAAMDFDDGRDDWQTMAMSPFTASAPTKIDRSPDRHEPDAGQEACITSTYSFWIRRAWR